MGDNKQGSIVNLTQILTLINIRYLADDEETGSDNSHPVLDVLKVLIPCISGVFLLSFGLVFYCRKKRLATQSKKPKQNEPETVKTKPLKKFYVAPDRWKDSADVIDEPDDRIEGDMADYTKAPSEDITNIANINLYVEDGVGSREIEMYPDLSDLSGAMQKELPSNRREGVILDNRPYSKNIGKDMYLSTSHGKFYISTSI